MKDITKKHSGLLAAATIMALGAGLPLSGPSLKHAHREGYRPTPPRRDTALQREIAEHNAAVEARKAEKRAKKRGA